MSHDRYGDTDLVYWMGRSVNAMTREELQVALGEAIMQIENIKSKAAYWQSKYIMKDCINESFGKSRFTDPDYIASFC